jgi:hypothetical protein
MEVRALNELKAKALGEVDELYAHLEKLDYIIEYISKTGVDETPLVIGSKCDDRVDVFGKIGTLCLNRMGPYDRIDVEPRYFTLPLKDCVEFGLTRMHGSEHSVLFRDPIIHAKTLSCWSCVRIFSEDDVLIGADIPEKTRIKYASFLFNKTEISRKSILQY